jgi:hypothetical protein
MNNPAVWRRLHEGDGAIPLIKNKTSGAKRSDRKTDWSMTPAADLFWANNLSTSVAAIHELRITAKISLLVLDP